MKALGENKTIEYLDVSTKTPSTNNLEFIKKVLKGAAFNAMKNGALTQLIARGCFSTNYYDHWL